MNAPFPAFAIVDDPAITEQGRELEAAIDAGAIDLPLLPGTAMKVFRLAQDPNVDIEVVAELVERDQKMASQVLRVVNSAAYSPKTAIVTLRQAITRLGLKPLSEIVIASAFKATVFEDDRFAEQIEQYWMDSMASALWNKELARLRRQNVETAYLCGLLHNIGKPLILKYATDNPKKGAEDKILPAVEALSPAIGFRLAQSWELPGPVQAAIRWHTQFEQAQDYRDDACAVNAALQLAAFTWTDDVEQAQEQMTVSPAFQALNIYPDDLVALLEKREKLAEQLESFR